LTGDIVGRVNVHAHIPAPTRPAASPGEGLALLREFVNTNDIEGGEDELATPELLRAWLAGRGLLPARASVDPETHRRALAIREGLRTLGSANNGEALDAHQLDALNQAARGLPLLISARSNDWALRPASGGADGFLAGVLATLARSMADGSWTRVKACRRDTCRWLFLDQSRNRSGTWCSMAGCGSRMKARAYRARQRKAATA
jgi:predicted RNA-binding Zn ribbon-like protein